MSTKKSTVKLTVDFLLSIRHKSQNCVFDSSGKRDSAEYQHRFVPGETAKSYGNALVVGFGHGRELL